jgi:diguanylate cyclase (GGDEF)-like protein
MRFSWFWIVLCTLSANVRAQVCPNPNELDRMLAAAESVPSEARALIESWQPVLDGAEACAGQQSARAIAIFLQAAATFDRSSHRDATYRSLTRALAIADASDDDRARHQVLVLLAGFAARAGMVQEASTHYQRMLNIAKSNAWQVETVQALSDYAALERKRANYFSALGMEREALALRRAMNPPSETWKSLANLAVLYEQIELFELSRASYEEAWNAAKANGSAVDIADAELHLAGFLNDFGNGEEARALELAEHALSTLKQQNPVREASAMLQVARARMALGQYSAAEVLFSRAHALANHANAKNLLAHVQFRWGELEYLRGQTAAALGRIEQARAAYVEINNRHRLIKVEALLERIYQTLGRDLEAARSGREHFRLRNEVLGSGAVQKLSELLGDFELSEERLRNAELKNQNAVSKLKLLAERRYLQLGIGFTVLLAVSLLALAWRHRQAKRLNRLLSSQRMALQQANQSLEERGAELYKATITDPLTGLYNRRYAMANLNAKLTPPDGKPRASSIAILILDLDNFKHINDTFGHPVGDEALLSVAEALTRVAANHGLLARIGGEEFLLCLENYPRYQVQQLADKLRAEVELLSIKLADRVLRTTVSIGISYCGPDVTASLSELLRISDLCLYEAKKRGRNVVVMQP